MAIEPVTREERFLAAAGGQSVTTPEPITRKEQLLQGIIDAVKSGGVTPDVIEGAVNDYLNANPVKPGATTEQAAQIEQNKTDIADLQTDVDELKESGGNGSGQNLTLDTTLSKSGAAADAKAVGDALAKVGKPTSEQVQEAVQGYLAENGVAVEPQWADFPRITNPALDIKNAVAMDERITLGTDGTLRHNLMIENALISWSESRDNTDNAAGDCHVKLCCWRDVFGSGHTDKTPTIRTSDVVDVFPAGSSILGVDGSVIDTVAASSDSCIIDCTGGAYIIGAICRGAATGYHMVYRRATVASNTITMGDTINVLKINGAEWDMSTMREDYTNPLSQINTRVISTGGYYYMAVVQSHVGVAILKSANGIDWTLANHIPDKDCYIEASIGLVSWSSNKFPFAYVAVRHDYGDGYISLYGLQTLTGAVMTKTLIPAATGRPMLCGGFLDKKLYIAYSVNGRQNAVLGMIMPRSDGTTGISILTTPVGVMSNYPAMWVREGSNGEWFILFGGTDGMNTNKSAVSVAYLWNQDNPNIAEKNAKLRDLMFGDTGAVEDDAESADGGTGSWETLLDVTTTEEQWCIYQAFPTTRKLRRLRAYIETVGTATNGSATRVLLVPYSSAATWYPNGLADSGAEGLMADDTKKYIYMDADIMASCTMGSAWIQACEKGGWSGEKIVGNRDAATKSSTEFAGIAIVPASSKGTHVFGVGTRVVIEGY